MSSIIKLNRLDGSVIDVIDLNINANAFVISDYLDAWTKTNDVIPFSIQVTPIQIPLLNNPEFYLAVREKVDLTANNVYNNIITNEDKDIGSQDYINSSPYQPRHIPNNFIELKGT